jgi:hypothetical protein
MSRFILCLAAANLAIVGLVAGQTGQPSALFHPSAQCTTCHNGLVTPAGEDVSMGTSWRPSMMANSARDPYWHAGVRREVIDHPAAQSAIENECSRCHMPMAHVTSHLLEQPQSVFVNLPVGGNTAADPLAVDGVSCALCHQMTADRLGTRESFTGGFVVATVTPPAGQRIYGPFDVTPGRAALMRSATGFEPAAATHIQRSEVCATCHTLYTHALDANAQVIGELPEQVPYQEWLHSAFRQTTSCQDCHMSAVEQPAPIASVLGEPREHLSRHDFRGANFVIPALLNRFRSDLGITALPSELDAAVGRTRSYLRDHAATIAVEGGRRIAERLEVDIVVRNLAGHKLPTAYPSRRAWLHVTVRDGTDRIVFSSGAPQPDGAIAGNDNDEDGETFEPHYREIRSPDEVMIYEAILGAPNGAVTTGLLTAVSYLKDNRILPQGFTRDDAPEEVKPRGDAATDPDFAGGADRVRYSIDIGGAEGPFTVEAQLWYQPIAYRWAANLEGYDAPEPMRFVGYFRAMAGTSAAMLTRTSTTVR